MREHSDSEDRLKAIEEAFLALPTRQRQVVVREHLPAWNIVIAAVSGMIFGDYGITEKGWGEIEKLEAFLKGGA